PAPGSVRRSRRTSTPTWRRQARPRSRVSAPQRGTRAHRLGYGLTIRTAAPQAWPHHAGLRHAHLLLLREALQEALDARERSSPARLGEGTSSAPSVRPPHAMRLCCHEAQAPMGGVPCERVWKGAPVLLVTCCSRRSLPGRWHASEARDRTKGGDSLRGPAPCRADRQSRRYPAGHGLLRRPAALWCHTTAGRGPRTRRCHIAPHTCPSPRGTPTEACRARGPQRADARRRCRRCSTHSPRTAP